MSTSPISFSVALSQLGGATSNLLYATWRAPFTGGPVRMVTLGLPILFITAATGAVIFYVMSAILIGAKNKATRWVGSGFGFWSNRKIQLFHPAEQNAHIIPRGTPIPRNQKKPDETPKIEVRSVPVEPLRPLPPDAAKERNEALLRFLDLADQYLITPLVLSNEKLLKHAEEINDPFLGVLLKDINLLQQWLRSIVLWQLGEQWENLETKFVKMETPEPPTLESIAKQIKQEKFEEGLEEALLAPIEKEEAPSEGRVSTLQKVITNSELSDEKKMTLMTLSLQFDHLLKDKEISPETRKNEIEKHRRNFAVVMNKGLANSLGQIIGGIKGWIEVIEKLSPSKKPLEPPGEDLPDELPERMTASFYTNSMERMVSDASNVLSNELSTNYLHPLWSKQQLGWQNALQTQIENESIDSSKTQLINKYLDGEIEDKAFLAESSLSTSLTSHVAFMRIIRVMQHNASSVEGSINTFPVSLLLHLQPTLASVLGKAFATLSEIPFETTVPRVVGYALDLFECCSAMQNAQKTALEAKNTSTETLPNVATEPSLYEALTKGEQGDQADGVQKLYDTLPQELITGMDVIKRLNGNAHEAVRLSQPDIQEQTWIKITKVRLEGILRKRAARYSKNLGVEWLANLLKTNGTNSTSSLFGTILSLLDQFLTKFPGLEVIFNINLKGLQTIIEDKGAASLQEILNEITTTRYLSTEIGIGIVKLLLSQAKDQATWDDGYPVLRQAFEYLDEEEQKVVLEYIRAQNETKPSAEERITQLKSIMEVSEVNQAIAISKTQETELLNALNTLQAANEKLCSAETRNETPITALELGYRKIQRARDLKQFERIKGLVMFVVDDLLKRKLADKLNATLGSNIREIAMAILHEAYTLLSYQKVVKHLIFTITDILVNELELANEPSPVNRAKEAPTNVPSLFDFIPKEQQVKLQQKIASLANECHTRKGWTSVADWLAWGVKKATEWAPDTIWGWLTDAFKEDLRMTSPQLSKLIETQVTKLVTDPELLPPLIIDALSKNVADPGPKQ